MRRNFLDKDTMANSLRSKYPEYNRKPWGVLLNLIARGWCFFFKLSS